MSKKGIAIPVTKWLVSVSWSKVEHMFSETVNDQPEGSTDVSEDQPTPEQVTIGNIPSPMHLTVE